MKIFIKQDAHDSIKLFSEIQFSESVAYDSKRLQSLRFICAMSGAGKSAVSNCIRGSRRLPIDVDDLVTIMVGWDNIRHVSHRLRNSIFDIANWILLRTPDHFLPLIFHPAHWLPIENALFVCETPERVRQVRSARTTEYSQTDLTDAKCNEAVVKFVKGVPTGATVVVLDVDEYVADIFGLDARQFDDPQQKGRGLTDRRGYRELLKYFSKLSPFPTPHNRMAKRLNNPSVLFFNDYDDKVD